MTPFAPDVNDLNSLVPADKKVALGSNVYVVPGDMPMEVYLRAQAAFATDDEIESSNLLKHALQDLMLWNVPLGEEGLAIRQQLEASLRSLGVRTMIVLLQGIYSDGDEDEAAGGDAAGESSVGAPTTETATPTTTGDSSSEPSPTPSLETQPEPTTVSAG